MSTPVRTSQAPQTAARRTVFARAAATIPHRSDDVKETAQYRHRMPVVARPRWQVVVVSIRGLLSDAGTREAGRSKDLLQRCRSAPGHGSEPNRSDDRRIRLAIRYIPTRLKQAVGQRDWATAGQLEDVDGIKRRGIVLAFLMRLKRICNHPSQWLGDGAWRFPTRARPRRSRAAANQEPSQPMSSGSE